MSGRSGAQAVLDELERLLPAGRVPAAVFGDEDLYRRELRAVFARCWVFVAHESEIPVPGSFVRRKIGEDGFIVVRNDSGGISVLFDACRHRGVQVCRADAGRTKYFRCPYHGWIYDTRGRLLGAPEWTTALEGMCREDNGLLPAAQIATRHGLVFATLDAAAPSLDAYLGDMSWYLDLVFGLNEHGVEVLAPPQRFVIAANWKSAAENFCGDDYHLGTLHRSVWDVGAFPVSFQDDMTGYHIQAAPGHSLSLSMAVDGAGADLLTWATLALVVGFTSASTPFASLLVIGATGGLGLALAVVVRPALARLRDRRLDATLLSMSLAGLLLCASLTAAFGAHEIFGAYLFGALFPRGRLSEQLSNELEVIAGVLLPVFFLTTGLQVGFRDLHRSGAAELVLLLLVACAGKVLGAAGASRSLGLRTREALAVGVLMNTRGLTELVVLHVGLTIGVLDGHLFTLLVLMALVTTAATAPLLGLIRPDPWLAGSCLPARTPRTPFAPNGTPTKRQNRRSSS